MQRNSFSSDKSSGVNIKVIVRCRPLNDKERSDVNNEEVVKIKNNDIIVTLNKNNEIYEKKYNFDYVCDEYVDQKTLFNDYLFQIVDEILEGFNCTLFCYGQTGTGKTYTMEGKIFDTIKNTDIKKMELGDSINSDTSYGYEMCDDEDTGIIFRVIKRIFDSLNKKKEGNKFQDEEIEAYSCRTCNSDINDSDGMDTMTKSCCYDYNIKVSYLEIYNEELCDLLSPANEANKLRIYEDYASKNKGLNVDKLEEKIINTFEDVYCIICSAVKRRKTADTLYNKKSSRSHSIFTIILTTKYINNGENITKIGKLNLVDLAGSENSLKSSVKNFKVRQQESCNINQSLLTLGRVINALVEKSSYIPYRDSKLTRLLQDSLGGKTKTFIVATISPSSLCIDETLGTLDYVYRAKNIKNKPEINVKTTKQEKIKDLNNEIEKLKNALILSREKKGVYLDNEEYNNIKNSLKKNKEIILEKNKILSKKTEEINNLLTQMDYTDDIKKQLVQLVKEIIAKYKNIQTLHKIMINKLAEEKYVFSFLMEEFQHMEEKYYGSIQQYKEFKEKTFEMFNENFVNLKKNIEKEKASLNQYCDNIMQILIETKNNINENKQSLGKSIKCFQKIINHLFFKKKDLLNFVLDHLDIVQKYDQNYIFVIDKIKKHILKCKLRMFSKEQILSASEKLQAEKIEITHPEQDEGHVECKRRIEYSEKALHFFKEITVNNEEIEKLDEISKYLTQEKMTTQSVINCIQVICNLFHTFLYTFTINFKKNVEEKNAFLKKETQNFYKIVENLNNDYNSFEKKINETNSEMINSFKTEIKQEIQMFQEQLLDEIKNVVAKNVHNMNEKINVRFEKFNSNLHNQTKQHCKNLHTNSINILETFLTEYQTKTKNYHENFLEAHDKFCEKIETYYSILNKIFIDLFNTITQDEIKAENNVNNIIDIYNETVRKNNCTVEEIAEQFHQHTNDNINEKEQLYQIISKKILQEKNEVSEEEEKANMHADKSNENVKTCTNKMLENVDRIDIHINEIISFISKNFIEKVNDANVINDLQNDQHNEKKEKEEKGQMENIKNIIEQIRNVVNSQCLYLNAQNTNPSIYTLEKKEKEGEINNSDDVHLIDIKKKENINQGKCENSMLLQTPTTVDDVSEKNILELGSNRDAVVNKEKENIGDANTIKKYETYTKDYLKTKKKVLQELEKIVINKNLQFQQLFDNLHENLHEVTNITVTTDRKNILENFKFGDETNTIRYEITNNNETGSNSSHDSFENNDYDSSDSSRNKNTFRRTSNNNIVITNSNKRIEKESTKVLKKNTLLVTSKNEGNSSVERKLNINECSKTEVENISRNVKPIKNSSNVGNNINDSSTNASVISENKSPSNKISTFETQSKKTFPFMKRLNNDNTKNKKFKFPRTSKNIL